jgi:orotate phosphoribosyltransferase-like protein
MLSVVEDFNKLKKYNIESILGINNAGIPEQPKKEKSSVEAEEIEAELVVEQDQNNTNEENQVEQDEKKEE